MDWQPPTADNQGRYSVADWRPLRDAIVAAYRVLGIEEGKDGIDRRDWNLVLLAMSYRDHASRPTCVECREPVEWHEAIRCFDCKAPLHERCASHHFWPNGRPSESLPQWKR